MRVRSISAAALSVFTAFVSVTAANAQDADLAVIKTGPAVATAGSNVSYSITVSNFGPFDASSISLVDPLPGSMTFVSVNQNSGPAFSCSGPSVGSGGTVTCSAAALLNGASANFTLVAQIPAGTPAGTDFTNQASVSSAVDPNPENDTGVAVTSTPLPAQADIAVSKSGPSAAAPDSDVPYSIVVSSAGPLTSGVVTMSDTLPGAETFVSFTQNSGPTFSCTSGQTTTCTIAQMNPGDTASFTLVGHIPPGTAAGTTFTNVATVTSGSDPNPENDSSSVGTTVGSADLAITKTGPVSAIAGSPLAWTITVSNNGPDAAGNAHFDDTLPSGTTFTSLIQNTGPTAFCVFPPPGAGGAAGCSWTLLPLGATATFTLNATVMSGAAPGALTNTATVASDTGDATLSNNASSASTAITTQADVAVSKTGPAAITAGQNITYTIVVSNGGPSDAHGVSVTDAIPAGATFVSATQTAGTTVFSCTATTVVTCSAATLVSGDGATFSIVLKVAGSASGTMSNTASVTSTTPDTNPANNSQTVTTTINATADLGVVKTGPTAMTAGQKSTYTIVVTNNGPSDAATVSLSDVLPANITFVSLSQTGSPSFSCTPPAVGTTGTITCSAASMINGATATFTLVVGASSSAPAGTISNTATITSSTPDPTPGNNSSTTTAPISTSADLAVSKSGPASLTAGQSASYTIVVTNNGSSDAQTVSLTDTLPANSTFASLTQNNGPSFSCSTPPAGGSGTVTCTIATLAAGANATFTLALNTTIAAGTLTNTAVVTSATADPNVANNTASAVTSIGLPVADLSIVKTANALNVIPGTDVIYTIAVTNSGPASALGVTVTDTLPPTMTFVSASSTQGTCSGTTVVTCTPGSILTGTSVTITITAKASTTLGPTANTAVVSSTSADPNPANNSSTANVDIVNVIPALSPRMLLLLAALLAVIAAFAIRSR